MIMIYMIGLLKVGVEVSTVCVFIHSFWSTCTST